MKLEEMTDEQLNLLVHKEVMQLSVEPELMEDHYFGDYPDYECTHCGGKMGKVSGPCYAPVDVDSYATNLHAAAKMEAEIAKNIHTGQYVEELTRVLEAEWWPKYEQVSLFKLVTATPRLRVLAALKACGVEQHQPVTDGEGFV